MWYAVGQCAFGMCYTAFHATCARQHDGFQLHLPVDGLPAGYCPRHAINRTVRVLRLRHSLLRGIKECICRPRSQLHCLRACVLETVLLSNTRRTSCSMLPLSCACGTSVPCMLIGCVLCLSQLACTDARTARSSSLTAASPSICPCSTSSMYALVHVCGCEHCQ